VRLRAFAAKGEDTGWGDPDTRGCGRTGQRQAGGAGKARRGAHGVDTQLGAGFKASGARVASACVPWDARRRGGPGRQGFDGVPRIGGHRVVPARHTARRRVAPCRRADHAVSDRAMGQAFSP
jgi:hypothetical protein